MGAENETMEAVNEIIDNDPMFKDTEEDTGAIADDPASTNDAKLPKEAIGEDQEKPNDADKAKLEAAKAPGAIEPPVSWPSDDKAAFAALPTWAQERISARESEREAHFAERARTVAERERGLQDLQTRTTEAERNYVAKLQDLSQIAIQLMPAKFSDIQSEADYLRLKVEDPARASEFEAFKQVLGNAQRQHAEQGEKQLQTHLDKEWTALQSKYPEFKDPEKGPAMLNEVRKGCVDNYGFTQQEVQVIQDHRHVPIIQDALKWRSHLANLKAAEGKKVVAKQPAPALRQAGNSGGANLGTDQKNKVLNRAIQETDLRRRADILAGAL